MNSPASGPGGREKDGLYTSWPSNETLSQSYVYNSIVWLLHGDVALLRGSMESVPILSHE